MLRLLLRRLQHARRLGDVVVATSVDPSDDLVAKTAAAAGVGIHRGSLDDVLGRFLGAVGDHDGPIVRITGDCPLIDAQMVDATVDVFERTPGCAYASNFDPRCFPEGLDTEVISPSALAAVAAEATDPEDREHVTLAVRRQPKRFPAASFAGQTDLGALHWSVDTAADLEFVRLVVARLGERRHSAPMSEMLAAVRDNPSLARMGGRLRG